MLRDITLGQYYPVDSVIHRLDPRVKFGGTFIYIVSLFIINNLIGYFVAGVFLMICIYLSKVPVKFMLKGMKSIAVILLFAIVFNVFLTQGEVIWSWWKLSITKEGLITAGQMTVRLIFLVMGSSIMTLTTTPNNLTDAIESILKPLKIFRLPVHEIAMMMSIALRFIPILLEETDKIMKAQMARGADFESGNILKRAKNMVPILVPLFISAFRRANDLAMAMEARCYRGGDGRTKMKPLKYHSIDAIGYVVLIGYLAGCICLRVFGEYLV